MASPKTKPVGFHGPPLLKAMASSRLGALATNWVFQGMRYMQWQERLLKLGSGAVLAAFLLFISGADSMLSVLVALWVAHSCNWLLNGSFFVLVRYLHPIPNAPSRFDDYLALVHQAALNHPALDGLAVFGSYCRGSIHQYSDLDVRVIAKPGFLSGLSAALFCMRLRFGAFFRRFPLDIYSFDDTAFLDRLREDEKPLVLLDRSGRLEEKYG